MINQMDIRKRLEEEHSKTLTMAIVKYVGEDKKKFRELLTVFLQGGYRVTQRAAWPLSNIAVAHPQLIAPHLGKLVAKLNEPGHHPAVTRNILRIFQDLDIPEKYHGSLVDTCFGLITSEAVAPAIRAFAITTAANICKPYPELRKELSLVLGDLARFPQPPAIKHRLKLALKEY